MTAILKFLLNGNLVNRRVTVLQVGEKEEPENEVCFACEFQSPLGVGIETTT